MQMSTLRTTGITTQAYRFTSLNHLVFLYQLFTHMTIQGLQTIGMADNDITAIAFTLIINNTNLTTKSSTNGVTNINLDVCTIMVAMESLTITVVTGHQTAVCRHMETTQIYLVFVWHLYTIVSCVYIIPLRIQRRSWRLLGFFVLEQTNNRKTVYCTHLLIHGSHTCQFVLCYTRSGCTSHKHHKNEFLHYHRFHFFALVCFIYCIQAIHIQVAQIIDFFGLEETVQLDCSCFG